MTKTLDLTGQRFGRLTVLGHGPVHVTKGGNTCGTCLCLCDCGNQVKPLRNALVGGRTTSCGCVRRGAGYWLRRQAGKEYRTWAGLIDRCCNPTNKNFDRYGGRGIAVCPRWRDSFEMFFSDMGMAPSPIHSIDRINNDGDYCPENCRWATPSEQSSNRRSNHFVMVGNTRMTIAEAAKSVGLSYNTVHGRIVRGWSVDRALATPLLRQR